MKKNRNLSNSGQTGSTLEISKQSSLNAGNRTIKRQSKSKDRQITMPKQLQLAILNQKQKLEVSNVQKQILPSEVLSQNILNSKYQNLPDKYQEVKVINDLVYNEPMHSVSVFKDYLISDDVNEFLKRPYTTEEQRVRMNRLCDFYDQYSQVYPNYITLIPEPANYLFKNIQRKQRLIDEKLNLNKDKLKLILTPNLNNPNPDVDPHIFNTKFLNSVMRNDSSFQLNSTNNAEISKQSINVFNVYSETSSKLEKRKTQGGGPKIQQIVDEFLIRDSNLDMRLETDAMGDEYDHIFNRDPEQSITSLKSIRISNMQANLEPNPFETKKEQKKQKISIPVLNSSPSKQGPQAKQIQEKIPAISISLKNIVKKNLAQDVLKVAKKVDISKSTRRQSTSKTSEPRALSKNSKPRNSIMNRAKSPPVIKIEKGKVQQKGTFRGVQNPTISTAKIQVQKPVQKTLKASKSQVQLKPASLSNRGQNKGVVTNAPGDQVSDIKSSSNSSANSDSTVKLEDYQDAANDEYINARQVGTGGTASKLEPAKSPDVLSSVHLRLTSEPNTANLDIIISNQNDRPGTVMNGGADSKRNSKTATISNLLNNGTNFGDFAFSQAREARRNKIQMNKALLQGGAQTQRTSFTNRRNSVQNLKNHLNRSQPNSFITVQKTKKEVTDFNSNKSGEFFQKIAEKLSQQPLQSDFYQQSAQVKTSDAILKFDKLSTAKTAGTGGNLIYFDAKKPHSRNQSKNATEQILNANRIPLKAKPQVNSVRASMERNFQQKSKKAILMGNDQVIQNSQINKPNQFKNNPHIKLQQRKLSQQHITQEGLLSRSNSRRSTEKQQAPTEPHVIGFNEFQQVQRSQNARVNRTRNKNQHQRTNGDGEMKAVSNGNLMKINTLNPNINFGGMADKNNDNSHKLLQIECKNIRSNTLKTYDLKSVLSPVGITSSQQLNNNKGGSGQLDPSLYSEKQSLQSFKSGLQNANSVAFGKQTAKSQSQGMFSQIKSQLKLQ